VLPAAVEPNITITALKGREGGPGQAINRFRLRPRSDLPSETAPYFPFAFSPPSSRRIFSNRL
jgi:hypothetical protein